MNKQQLPSHLPLDALVDELVDHGGRGHAVSLHRVGVDIALVGAVKGGGVIRASLFSDDLREPPIGWGSWSRVDGVSWRTFTKRWTVRSAADRRALVRELTEAIDRLAPRSKPEFVLAPIPEDGAGFGQVGCAFILISAPVGGVIGLVFGLLATAARDPSMSVGAAVVGMIGGWVSGPFLASGALRLAGRVRQYRYVAEEVGFVFAAIGPGIVALVVTILAAMSYSSGPGR